jgi:hypothetical protein
MVIDAEKRVKAVRFDEVAVGASFKEKPDGTWHLKTGASKGMYQSWGTRYEPAFKADEQVYIEV